MKDLLERFVIAWQRALDNAKQEVSEDLGVLERADLVYEIVIIRYIVAGYHEEVNLEEFDDVVSEIRSYLNRVFAHLALQFDPRQHRVQALWSRLLSCEFAIVGCQPTEAYFDLFRATEIANIICNTGLTRDSELVTLRFLVRRFKMRAMRRGGNQTVTARVFELNAIAAAIGAVVTQGELSLDALPIEGVLEPLLDHLEQESVPNEALLQRLDNALQLSLQ
jgi:hypothetical protein